jgi:eukaryotic-like serine/threonine-protein kinase
MPGAWANHPSAKEMSDFGLGKLPRARADAVAEHLTTCPDCQAVPAEQGPDSLIDRLRAAAPKSGTVLPGVRPLPEEARKAPPADFPPELTGLGKFEEPRKLGEGGMGAVWRARHALLDKDVAIKVMNSAALGSPEARERFLAEMRAGGRLGHPNVAQTIDAGVAGGLLFMVMEFVAGQSLQKYVARNGPMPVRLACDLAAQAALGLQHAYEKGLAHRDIKPANLMVTRDSPTGTATWRRQGDKMWFRWPNGKAPGGPWVDAVTLSADGTRYAGKNNHKPPGKVVGKKVR